jgi:hypothetical protein
MRKITTVLVFAMVMILTAVAHAEALYITDGTLVLEGLDSFGRFSGDGFSGGFSIPFGVSVGFAFGTGTDPVSFLRPLGAGSGFASVIVGNANCTVLPSFSCGTITVTSLPMPLPPNNDWLFDPNGFSVFTPFTATGHLNVGSGFDLVGQGTLEGLFCNPQVGCPQFGGLAGFTTLIYRFSAAPVAEPPTRLLAAFGLFGALFIARFFVTAGHRAAVRL